jgi:VWFA-related protein
MDYLRPVFFTLFVSARCADSQTNHAADQKVTPYRLSVSVDEVSLTFHAADARGISIDDLKLQELSLLDNGRPPLKILDFQPPQHFPTRVGVLLDMSQSMEESGPDNRAIAIQYVQRFLRPQTDRAFVTKFDTLSRIAQPWTNDATALATGIRNHISIAKGRSHFTGTAMFDAIYEACLNQFGRIDSATSGNLILLFSDGEDNASKVSLAQAVDICQRVNTAIYAFRPKSQESSFIGVRTLMEITSESGGRIFHEDDSEAQIDDDLKIIEAERRSQYRLIYRRAELKRDGSFHRIDLEAFGRANSIVTRSGYYAPAH